MDGVLDLGPWQEMARDDSGWAMVRRRRIASVGEVRVVQSVLRFAMAEQTDVKTEFHGGGRTGRLAVTLTDQFVAGREGDAVAEAISHQTMALAVLIGS